MAESFFLILLEMPFVRHAVKKQWVLKSTSTIPQPIVYEETALSEQGLHLCVSVTLSPRHSAPPPPPPLAENKETTLRNSTAHTLIFKRLIKRLETQLRWTGYFENIYRSMPPPREIRTMNEGLLGGGGDRWWGTSPQTLRCAQGDSWSLWQPYF